MKVQAKGRVLSVNETRHKEKKYVMRRNIVVLDQDGDEPEFTFFGREGVGMTEGLVVGEDVEVDGRCTSRVWQDKRFKDVNGVFIKVLSKAAPVERDREPGDDDDVPMTMVGGNKIPF